MEETMYQLTPKGIFEIALTRTNLVKSTDDWRIEAAWTIFQLMMEQNGYVKDGDEDE